MKKLLLIFLLLVTATAMAVDVIYLKNGKRYYGEITDIGEKTITIKTKLGKLTYPWDVLKIKTIKQYNPTMFEEIRKQKMKEFEEKKKKLGLVKYVKKGKVKWVLPKQKEEYEMRDKGMELYEDEWMPTNEIAEIKLKIKMEAAGMIKYLGKWYKPDKVDELKELKKNKGLKIGMSDKDVIAMRGKPTLIKKSDQFKTQKLEMWFYEDEENEKEDRLIFKLGHLDSISVDQELSDK